MEEVIWFNSANLPDRWNDIEIHPVVLIFQDKKSFYESCDDNPELADFWSVYLRNEIGGLHCIADLPTEEDAKLFAELIQKLRTNIETQNTNPVL
jgi:hypothetical protein